MSTTVLRLRYHTIEGPVSVDVSQEIFVMGRDPSCDLVIADSTVSRRHAQILRERNLFAVQDLDSKNGIRLNGTPVEHAALRHGDELAVGQVPLGVEIVDLQPEPSDEAEEKSATQSRVILDNSKWEGEGTIVRSVEEMEKFLAGEKAPASEAALLESENRILMVLSQVARALIAAEPLKDTLNTVMDLVLKHIKASRAFLMLREGDEDELVPTVVRVGGGNGGEEAGADEPSEIRMSRTIAQRVLEEKVAILSSDVQADPRFRDGDSIRIMGIQSAMCAPLWNKEHVIGLIQVDSPLKETVYAERDLDLLTALGNYAAVAIERARLNEHLEHERELKSRLQRYHSPQVAERIMAARDDTGGFMMQAAEKNVTVLFADLVGFTPLSARLSPTEIALMLNEVFAHFTDAIFRHQGTLDKYLGDAVMAVFGAPMDQEDHALQAAKTAFDMLDAIRELNEKRPEDAQLAFHIGLNSGPVVAGDIGSPKRMEYTVLGNTVNLAARIQAKSPPNVIWAGPATYEAVRGRVEAKEAGKKTFAGVEKPILIYQLKRLILNEDETHATEP
jgi:adenylate cyclase